MVGCVAASVQAQEAFEWKSEPPAAHGFDAKKLEAWRQTLAEHRTDCLLLIRDDKVVLEWYADGWSATRPHGTASLAKALVGGVSLAVAMQDGRLSPDDPASKFVPQWRSDPLKSKVTLAHLATHSSGVQDAEMDGIPHDKLPGWMGAFWARKPDPFTISRDDAPVLFEPGSRFHYSNPGMAMLSYAITASMKGTPHEDVRTLLKERVMRPIGVGDKEWSAGYGATYDVDGLKLVANWGGAAFTPRAAARVGRLMMRKGDWDGRRVLDAQTIERVLTFDRAPQRDDHKEDPSPNPALAWWTNARGAWKNVPRDAFGGAGAGNQVLLVIPSLKLILVRNGQNLFDPKKGENFWSGAETYLFNPLMAALTESTQRAAAESPPAPPGPSPVIRGVEFDPPSSVKRDAPGSDNWPVTWGKDGHLYTSYGDGWGFEPKLQKKVSMGFARIEGDPPAYRAVNLRSQSGERTGDGARGAKVSGMLSAGGVLYAWARNTDNATLIWSEDSGKSWEWGWKFTESFATPTFLNYGKDYEGARDGYVYTFSQDGNSAYEPSDAVVLARVPKDRIRDRVAWEFYAGAGKWAADAGRRRPVVEWAGKCERTDVVYDAPIRRYLMTLGFGHGKGWAILDAPEPWGPWTVAWTADAWDGRETHGYRIPTKWITEDGRVLWLVYSGRGEDDAFCLRRMTLNLR